MTESLRTPFDDLPPSAVLCAQEIADRLGVEARSVRRAISRGDLPASRACGIRVLACDAANWWRARMVVPGPAPAASREAPPAPLARRPARPRGARRTSRGSGRLPLPQRGDGR